MLPLGTIPVFPPYAEPGGKFVKRDERDGDAISAVEVESRNWRDGLGSRRKVGQRREVDVAGDVLGGAGHSLSEN